MMLSAAESLLMLFGRHSSGAVARAESVLAARPAPKATVEAPCVAAAELVPTDCCQVTPGGRYPRIVFIRCRVGRVNYEEGVVYVAHPDEAPKLSCLSAQLRGGPLWARHRRARQRAVIETEPRDSTTHVYKLVGFSLCDHRAEAYDD